MNTNIRTCLILYRSVLHHQALYYNFLNINAYVIIKMFVKFYLIMFLWTETCSTGRQI